MSMTEKHKFVVAEHKSTLNAKRRREKITCIEDSRVRSRTYDDD